MNYNTLASLGSDRIISLVDQYVYHIEAGNEVNASLIKAEIRDLASHLDNDDYQFFWQSYFRNLSSDYGVSFEITHGDPELMFGGI